MMKSVELSSTGSAMCMAGVSGRVLCRSQTSELRLGEVNNDLSPGDSHKHGRFGPPWWGTVQKVVGSTGFLACFMSKNKYMVNGRQSLRKLQAGRTSMHQRLHDDVRHNQ